MNQRSSYAMDDEKGVFLSLCVSLGFVLLAAAGWWLWTMFPSIVTVIFELGLMHAP